MKTKLLFAAVALVAATFPLSADAQNQPYDKWCRDQGIGRGSVQVCWAYTYEQCMASRTSQAETCYLNPRYDPRWRQHR
jgi:hypothetical protein